MPCSRPRKAGEFEAETANRVNKRMRELEAGITGGKWRDLVPACDSAFPIAGKTDVTLPAIRLNAQLACEELAEFTSVALEGAERDYGNELAAYRRMRSELNDALAPGLRARAGSELEAQHARTRRGARRGGPARLAHPGARQVRRAVQIGRHSRGSGNPAFLPRRRSAEAGTPACRGSDGGNHERLRQRLRRWHIWLGWIVGLPFLAWTVSGLVMVARPIETVRGEDLIAEAPALAGGAGAGPARDRAAAARLAAAGAAAGRAEMAAQICRRRLPPRRRRHRPAAAAARRRRRRPDRRGALQGQGADRAVDRTSGGGAAARLPPQGRRLAGDDERRHPLLPRLRRPARSWRGGRAGGASTT